MSLGRLIEEWQVRAAVCLYSRQRDTVQAGDRLAQFWDAGRVGEATLASFDVGLAIFHQGQDEALYGLVHGRGEAFNGTVTAVEGLILAGIYPPTTLLVLGLAVAAGNLHQRLRR
jgi:hypothetical protein